MGNCLVTKLKETVQNDNLVKVGEMLFKCMRPDGGHSSLKTAYLEGIDAKSPLVTCTITGGEWRNGGGTAKRFVTTSPRDIAADTVGAIVHVLNKYKIKRIQTYYAFEFNLDDLEYCTGMTYINAPSVSTGRIDKLKNLPLETLQLGDAGVTGNIGQLPTTLVSCILRDCDVTGNINTAFANHNALTSLDVSNCPNVTGSASAFLAAHPGCTLTYAGSGVTA